MSQERDNVLIDLLQNVKLFFTPDNDGVYNVSLDFFIGYVKGEMSKKTYAPDLEKDILRYVDIQKKYIGEGLVIYVK